jgi:hypothetical protein
VSIATQVKRAAAIYSAGGISPLFLALSQYLRHLGSSFVNYITLIYLRQLNRFKVKTFRLEGKEYAYFYHPYNCTWSNERCVELAISQAKILESRPQGSCSK